MLQPEGQLLGGSCVRESGRIGWERIKNLTLAAEDELDEVHGRLVANGFGTVGSARERGRVSEHRFTDSGLGDFECGHVLTLLSQMISPSRAMQARMLPPPSFRIFA